MTAETNQQPDGFTLIAEGIADPGGMVILGDYSPDFGIAVRTRYQGRCIYVQVFKFNRTKAAIAKHRRQSLAAKNRERKRLGKPPMREG